MRRWVLNTHFTYTSRGQLRRSGLIDWLLPDEWMTSPAIYGKSSSAGSSGIDADVACLIKTDGLLFDGEHNTICMQQITGG